MTFSTVDAYGKVRRERVVIRTPNYADWAKLQNPKSVISEHHLSVGIALTAIQYEESSLSRPVTLDKEFALTVKASYSHRLFSSLRWDFGLSGFLTALPLTSSDRDVALRFLGLNARLGYVFPGLPETWRLSLMAGYYYNTSIASAANPENILGYSGVGGPELYPTFRKTLANGRSILGYFKFAPVTSSLSILNLSSREIAVGLGYGFELGKNHPASVALDISQIRILIPSYNGFMATSNTQSLGLNYGF